MKYRYQRLKQALAGFRAGAAITARELRRMMRGRLMCILLASLGTLAVYARFVTGLKFFLILDDGKYTVLETYADDAGQALLEAGIHVSQNDYVSVPEGSASGLTAVSIYRAVDVTVGIDGENKAFTMLDGTVASALRKAGYEPLPLDLIEPPPETPLYDGMAVIVTRREIYTESADEILPFNTVRQDNPYIKYGSEVTTQEGADGSREVVYRVTLHDGVEISREILSETVTPPVDEIIQCGNGGTVTMKDGTVLKYTQKFEVTATAYTTERQQNKLNALGKIARVGTIAVDPKVIKLRTKVYVVAANGSWEYGIALCEDTGGVIKGNKIDIYFDTWDECVSFGVRKTFVYIVE